jgi:hypothetical protein
MKRTLSLEYNSTREPLMFYEYGRIIQKMVEHAKRQVAAEAIVDLIHFLNPQTRNVLEFKQKLWRHVFMMADNDLDVDHPFDHLPVQEDKRLKHTGVPYPQHEFPSRHYGYNIRVMIDKALLMEDGPVKQGFVETILSYMKLSYRNWIKEHYVNDEIIISDLSVMSNGKLSVSDDHTIEITTKANQPNANQSTFKTTNNKYKKYPNNNNKKPSNNPNFKKRK